MTGYAAFYPFSRLLQRALWDSFETFICKARDGAAAVVTQSFAALQSEERRRTISRNATKIKIHWGDLLHRGPAYWRNHSGSLYMQSTTVPCRAAWASSGITNASSYLYILLCISSLMAVDVVPSPPEESSGHFQLQLVIVLKKIKSLRVTHHKSKVPHTQCALAVPLFISWRPCKSNIYSSDCKA